MTKKDLWNIFKNMYRKSRTKKTEIWIMVSIKSNEKGDQKITIYSTN